MKQKIHNICRSLQLKWFFFGFVALILSSCTTTIDSYYAPKSANYQIKTIYLVNKGEGSQEMDERIKKNLENRNLKVVVGPDTNRVTNEDAILKYSETWKTELTTYLASFDLVLLDRQGQILSTSHWKNSKVSTFTMMGSVIENSLESVFEKIVIPNP